VTRAERKVLNLIGACHGAFAELPQSHPSDLPDFVNGVHIMQGLIMQRVARRAEPKSFPTYKTKVLRKFK
jgi:hypothetical protein